MTGAASRLARLGLASADTLIVAPGFAGPNATIVGMWRLAGQACAATAGAIAIQSLALVFDEYACSFNTVSRDGPVVRWRGACGPAGGEATRSIVVARSDGTTLRLSINGDDNGRYVRCQGIQ